MISRRGFIGGLVSALAAPAIVHAGNLMPVKVIEQPEWFGLVRALKEHQEMVNTLTVDHIRAIAEAMRNMPQWPIYDDCYIILHPRPIPC